MTQLLDLCESDLTVREVMRRRGASRETLRSLFDFLVETGAGGSAKGHYVAASVLCSSQTLDFALRYLGAFQSAEGHRDADYPPPQIRDVESPPE
jgi:hypothetical protein